MTTFNHFVAEDSGNHCGKRRNCSLRAISPFPIWFSALSEEYFSISSHFEMPSANSINLGQSKICGLGKG